MTRYVVDANIAAKWFLDEEHAVIARRLGNGQDELIAPDFICIEVANVLLRRHRSGGISRADSDAALTILPTMVRTQSSSPLIRPALALALAHGRSIYDALYVALAARERCPP